MANDKVYTDYLMHGRTKGSRNGISTTKGYTAIGQKAKGRWVNGRYVYDTSKSYGGNVENTQSGRVTKPLSPYVPDEYLSEVEYNSRKNDGSYAPHPTAASVNASHNAYVQSEANKKGMNAAYEYAKRQALKKKATNVGDSETRNNWQQQANAAASGKPSGYNNSHYNAVSQASAERKSKEAALARQKKASMQNAGKKNNWQQQANAAASGKPSGYNNSHYNAVSQASAERKSKEAALARQKKASMQNAGKKNNWQQTANKTAGILGNMSREDRSLMKSREWVSRDKNGKKQVNNGFNVNNKYGYSNYTKDDKGWHDVHMGEYNTAGVKGVKKQQDWNTSLERNHRSDIGNAIADAKEDAKKAFKEAKADAKQAFVNLKNKAKKKKKSLKDFFK